MSTNISLLNSMSRIETPYIKVQIGKYTFGVYQKTSSTITDNQSFYQSNKIIYPNYIQSLHIEKINGQVNQYTLSIIYPVRPQDDPNFFEKVFSSVNKTRKIIFSYGDMSVPGFVYKNEEAIITGITTGFDLQGSKISYTVSAVSSATLGYSGCISRPGYHDKPSNIIKQELNNQATGLKDIFYGMNNMDNVENLHLIPGDDLVVDIEAKSNISILDYLKYLVDCMQPGNAPLNNNQPRTFYVLTIHDEIKGETTNEDVQSSDIVTEVLGGPYFKITPVSKNVEHSDAYEIDIGFPTANIVTAFSIKNNENYSIYYNWQSELNDNEYVVRIDDDGKLVEEYAPTISSKNDHYATTSADKTWWAKVTQYPISATIQIKGLLRPATLMQYVKLNVLFYGTKHISSGTYIVTKQSDNVDQSGYRTTLELTRVVGEKSTDYDY